MPYFPMIASAAPRRRYSFGEYHAVLLDKVRSAQTIQYHFVLIVFRGQGEMPCLAVASEYSDAESKGAPFLGVFPGEGHLNMGKSTDWLVLDKFAAEAVRVALNRLGLPENQLVFVEEARKKPWWKFWSDWRQAREAKAMKTRCLREAPPPPPGIEVPKMFAYIYYKAFRYLAVGPAKYRQGDFFHLPPKEWSPEQLELVKRGCEQIVGWRGLTPESPLENIGIDGFYALLHVFHFKLKQQSAFDGGHGTILDKMEMKHAATSEEVTLYNRGRPPQLIGGVR